MVEELQNKDCVGVISRGYGSQSKTYPLLVTPETDPVQGGDEPVLIAKRTGCACGDFTESSASYRITFENTGLRILIISG